MLTDVNMLDGAVTDWHTSTYEAYMVGAAESVLTFVNIRGVGGSVSGSVSGLHFLLFDEAEACFGLTPQSRNPGTSGSAGAASPE